MLSDRLIRMIEHHADELTRALVEDLQSNPRTASYHRLSREAIHDRTYHVYKDLGLWLNSKAEGDIEASYTELGKEREAEGIPISRGRFRSYLDQVSSTRLYSGCRLGRFCHGPLPGAGTPAPC